MQGVLGNRVSEEDVPRRFLSQASQATEDANMLTNSRHGRNIGKMLVVWQELGIRLHNEERREFAMLLVLRSFR